MPWHGAAQTLLSSPLESTGSCEPALGTAKDPHGDNETPALPPPWERREGGKPSGGKSQAVTLTEQPGQSNVDPSGLPLLTHCLPEQGCLYPKRDPLRAGSMGDVAPAEGQCPVQGSALGSAVPEQIKAARGLMPSSSCLALVATLRRAGAAGQGHHPGPCCSSKSAWLGANQPGTGNRGSRREKCTQKFPSGASQPRQGQEGRRERSELCRGRAEPWVRPCCCLSLPLSSPINQTLISAYCLFMIRVSRGAGPAPALCVAGKSQSSK